MHDFLTDSARMHVAAARARARLTYDAADSDERPDLGTFDIAAGEERVQHREQVRARVEAVLGKALQEVGTDYALPDGRLVAIYYSKIHDNGDTFLGVQNRIKAGYREPPFLRLIVRPRHLHIR